MNTDTFGTPQPTARTRAARAGISCESDGPGLRVCLWGDVDAELRPQASGAMARVMAEDGAVALDASAVTFIDSAGMAFIVQIYFLCRAQERDVVLVDPSPVILDLLELLGLTGSLTPMHTKPTAMHTASVG